MTLQETNCQPTTACSREEDRHEIFNCTIIDIAEKDFQSFFVYFQNSWTLWFFKPDKVDRNKKWEDCQRSIITFNTVEDFWALYNHIEQASKLNAGCDYSLFKVSLIECVFF